MARKPIYCPKCGNLYSGQGKQCQDCFDKQQAEKKALSAVCPLCGGRKHRQSSICRECSMVKMTKPEIHITKICPVCKKEFATTTRKTDIGYGKYCGRPCAELAKRGKRRKRTRKILSCWMCGKEFEKHLSQIRKNVGDKHFCSSLCWYAYNRGENHIEWNGGSPPRQALYSSDSWRKAIAAVWSRDNGQCQRCGIKRQFTRITFCVHHIASFVANESLRADPDNLILLCQKCHRWVHSNRNTKKEFIRDASNDNG